MLINEIQESAVIKDVDAVVIALKSRTQEKHQAVKDTLEAIKWLEKKGVEKFYFKYCSTFDSTREGNIGPVADAIMEYLKVEYTILCPALPVNERIVKDGCLYVKGVKLDESPMKDHPLTPMWDCRIKNLIEAQSNYEAYELTGSMLEKEQLEIKDWIAEKANGKKPFYIIPDYVTDEDGRKIAETFGKLKFLTGGSGILEHLAKYMLDHKQENCIEKMKANNAPAVILAGSCSVATLGQIEDYREKGGMCCHLDPIALSEGKQTKENIEEIILNNQDKTILVYSSDKAENVSKVQQLGRERIASLIENTLSGIAADLVKKGYGRIIVAGGETSGAVTKALGYDVFKVGEAVAPGVPVMMPIDNEKIRLVLKSGNFGQTDFFTRALKITQGEKNERN